MSGPFSDPYVLSVVEAAWFCQCSGSHLRKMLHESPEFRKAVVIDWPGPERISLPKLCRQLHGTVAEEFIPEWKEWVEDVRYERFYGKPPEGKQPKALRKQTQ